MEFFVAISESGIFRACSTIFRYFSNNKHSIYSEEHVITPPETKQFILARIDAGLDVFKKLWGHQNFKFILDYTKAEAIR